MTPVRFLSKLNIGVFKAMDISKRIASRFQEIDDTVKSLREQLINYERNYYEKDLVAILEKKNVDLQLKVQRAVEELAILEGSESSNVRSNATVQVIANSTPNNSVAGPEPPAAANDRKKKVKTEVVKEKRGDANQQKKSAPSDEEPVHVGRLNMKIGKIVDIVKHPDADSLYVEQVDIGGPTPITVVSGLVKHVPIEEMKNRLVVILCNLKPAKMRGVLSEGMVMCASSPDKVEVLRPPPTSTPGDVVRVPGFTDVVPDPVLNPKKKIFETVAPDLKTDNDLCAVYKGVKWIVSGDKGHVTADSLKGVNVK